MKAQLCSCPDWERGARGRRMHCTLWWRRNTGVCCAADTVAERLALGEEAYGYFKYRHFPFRGVAVPPGSWIAKWPTTSALSGLCCCPPTLDAVAPGKEEGCSKSSSLPRSGDICDKWSLQREEILLGFPQQSSASAVPALVPLAMPPPDPVWIWKESSGG